MQWKYIVICKYGLPGAKTSLFGPKMALENYVFAPGQNLLLAIFFYCIFFIFSSRQSFWYVTWHGLTKLDITGAILGPKMALVAMFFGPRDLARVSNQQPNHESIKGLDNNEEWSCECFSIVHLKKALYCYMKYIMS